MPGTAAPSLIGIDTSTVFGNDRNAVPQFGAAISGTSGVVAAAVATATLPAVAGKTNYCTAIEFDYLGATGASVVVGTVTGIIGGAKIFVIGVPAGVGVNAQPLIAQFEPPLAATGTNTAITFSVPSLGAGNTSAQATIEGFLV